MWHVDPKISPGHPFSCKQVEADGKYDYTSLHKSEPANFLHLQAHRYIMTDA